MLRNYVFPTVNEALPRLLRDLEIDGLEIGSRAGVTRELTHVGITLEQPCNREILVAGRKASLAAQIAETMWVLSGRNDVEWLGRYLPRAVQFSDDQKVWRAAYGQRLRAWPRRDGSGDVVDQLRWVIDLLQKDRGSRQAVMSIWDPVTDTAPGKDIPCNDWLSFLSRLGRLDLHVAVRSNDAIWGWSGINQFEWSALLEIVAGMVGAEPGNLHFSTTSFHIYDRHWNKADNIVKNAVRQPAFQESPRFRAPRGLDFDRLQGLFDMWMSTEEAIRTQPVGFADSMVESFPEPMLQSWLRVLQWWWSGEREYLAPLEGTRLEQAALVGVQPKRKEPETRTIFVTDWVESVIKLHDEKHEAYGDSWKRRGEMLGILANIARKIDRLGKSETSDETSADTATDLLVYLAKYRVWLTEQGQLLEGYRLNSDSTTDTNTLLRQLGLQAWSLAKWWGQETSEEWLRKTFDRLEDAATRHDLLRFEIVDSMLAEAFVLASYLGSQVGDEYRGADAD